MTKGCRSAMYGLTLVLAVGCQEPVQPPVSNDRPSALSYWESAPPPPECDTVVCATLETSASMEEVPVGAYACPDAIFSLNVFILNTQPGLYKNESGWFLKLRDALPQNGVPTGWYDTSISSLTRTDGTYQTTPGQGQVRASCFYRRVSRGAFIGFAAGIEYTGSVSPTGSGGGGEGGGGGDGGGGGGGVDDCWSSYYTGDSCGDDGDVGGGDGDYGDFGDGDGGDGDGTGDEIVIHPGGDGYVDDPCDINPQDSICSGDEVFTQPQMRVQADVSADADPVTVTSVSRALTKGYYLVLVDTWPVDGAVAIVQRSLRGSQTIDAIYLRRSNFSVRMWREAVRMLRADQRAVPVPRERRQVALFDDRARRVRTESGSARALVAWPQEIHSESELNGLARAFSLLSRAVSTAQVHSTARSGSTQMVVWPASKPAQR